MKEFQDDLYVETAAFVSATLDEIDRGVVGIGLEARYVPSSAMPLIAAEAGFSWSSTSNTVLR
jgi:hypothetical protein